MEPVQIDIELKSNVAQGAELDAKALDQLSLSSKMAREQVAESLKLQQTALERIRKDIREVEADLKRSVAGTSKNTALQGRLKSLKQELDDEIGAMKMLRAESKRLGASGETLAQQLNAVRDKMQRLVSAGRMNTDEYRSLRAELSRLAEAQRAVIDEQQALAKGVNLTGLVQGLQAAVGLYSAMAGAVTLVSGETEQYEKAQAKLQSAIAICVGIQQVQQALTTTSAFRTKVVTAVTNAYTTSINYLTASLGMSTVMAKALMATLTLGLSVVITGIVAGLDRLITRQQKASKQQKELASFMADTLAPQLAKLSKLEAEWAKVSGEEQAKRKFVRDHAEDWRSLGVRITDAGDAERLFTSGKDAFVRSLEERAKAVALMSLAAEEYKEGIRKMQDAEREAADISFTDRILAGLEMSQGRAANSKDISEGRAKQTEEKARKHFTTAQEWTKKAAEAKAEAEKLFAASGLRPYNKDKGSTADRHNYAQELKRLRVTLEQETNSAILAAMQEGARKELAELEAQYESKKAKLTEYAEKLTEIEMQGKLDVSPQRAQLTALSDALKTQHELQSTAIREGSERAMRAIIGEGDEQFRSRSQARLDEVDRFYVALQTKAEKAAVSGEQIAAMSAQLTAQHIRARLLVTRELELEQLDFEERIALKRAEIFAESYITLNSDKEEMILRTQIELLQKRIDKLREIGDAGGDVANALKEAQVEMEGLNARLARMPYNRIKELGGGLKGVLDTLSGVGGELGEVFGSLSKGVDSVLSSLDPGASKMQRATAALSGLVEIYSMASRQARENAEAEARFAEALENAYHRAALSRLEALRHTDTNLFGVSDPYARITAGAKRYRQAMVELHGSLAKLSQGQMQVGTRKVVSGRNVAGGAGAGAGAGAGIGSFFGPVGTAIGAGVGAVIGGIFGSTQKMVVPVFQSISRQFGSILKQGTKSFELNPKILENYERLDDATKKLVDNWEEIRKTAVEAQKEMEESLKSLAGDLGTSLSQALVSGIGSNDIDMALRDFDRKLSETLHSIAQQQVFAAYFQGYFDQLSKGMKASFDAGGDNDIKDDIERFARRYKEAVPAYTQAIKQMQEELERQGFGAGDTRKSVARKGLAQASQDSIDELMGISTNQLLQLRTLVEITSASRAVQVAHLSVVRSMSRDVELIARNSNHLIRLEAIADELSKMSRDGIRINY